MNRVNRKSQLRRRRRWLGMVLLSLVMIAVTVNWPSQAATSKQVIYQVTWVSDNSCKITLKWKDKADTTPIRIATWQVQEDVLKIGYETGNQVTTGYDSRIITDSKLQIPVIVTLQDINATTVSVFPDLPKQSEQQQSIIHLYHLGIVNGYPDGKFQPDNRVIRAEFAKMLYYAAGFDSQPRQQTQEDSNRFKDVKPEYWAKPYINKLAAEKIVQGKGEDRFDPQGNITLGELFTILDRSFAIAETKPDYTGQLAEHWSNPYYRSLVKKGMIKQTDSYYKTYQPTQLATRKECALFLSRVLLNY